MADAPDLSGLYRALEPTLRELESGRRRTALRVWVTWIAAVAAMVICFAAWPTRGTTGSALVAMVFAALAAGYTTPLQTRFRNEFKAAVIGPLVATFDPGLSYQPEAGIAFEEFVASDLFRSPIDRYSAEDLIRGTVGRTALRLSEVDAEYKVTTNEGGGRTRTHWRTVFRGLFFIADFSKHFNGVTHVLPETVFAQLGGLGESLQATFTGGRGELVKLEDPEFETAFVVYSTDQVEARYLLSPALMRRLLDLRNRAGGTLHAAFVNANVYLAVSPGGNLFEPKLSRSLLDPALVEHYWADVATALGIVEDLDLNTRIWTKE